MAAAVGPPPLGPHAPTAGSGMRPVPSLDPQAMRAAPKRVVANDEVAAILRGLQLDKSFFLGKLNADVVEGLKPGMPYDANASETCEPDSRIKRRRSSIQMMSPDALQRRLDKDRVKARTAVVRTQVPSTSADGPKRMDFDIYLNQALLPVLAQSLDSLCRQLDRMEEQGDALDPRARARFNPLTWLAQQLLRRHPRCARTPRREAVYKDFREWSDQEKGRREMLRMKDAVHKVFNGFVLRGTVQGATIFKVVNAIDDTLKLGGVLKNNLHVQRAFGVPRSESPARGDSPPAQRHKGQGDNGDVWTFSQFWHQLATLFLAHDIVAHSAIEQGARMQTQEAQDRLAREEARQAMEESRKTKEADQRKQVEDYVELRGELMANPHIIAILEEDKILTGDDMRPGDIGYEFEVPPKGQHVALLDSLMFLLGFEPEPPQWMSGSDLQEVQEDEEWWTNERANSWSVLQAIHGSTLADGVVEKEVLQKVLVPPDGFLLLQSRVEDEFERRAEAGEGDYPSNRQEKDIPTLMGGSSARKEKPSLETLSERLGMTVDRISWLHDLFSEYLVPEEDAASRDGPPLRCGYPENPLSIQKSQMRKLVYDVNPNLTDAEFEARFRRIDEDCSGEIEFDEFVYWIHDDDVQVVHSEGQKLSVAELAYAYGEPVALVEYLHTCFKDQLPEDELDRYPEEPASLCKEDVRDLLESVTLRPLDFDDFEADWAIVDAKDKGGLDFDEFLEILHFDELPADVREKYP